MEEIRWITTPKCSVCIPLHCFRRRYACLGCYKLCESKAVKPYKKPVKETMNKNERLGRDSKIAVLRGQGLSYGQIAERLDMPRSTVQCAVGRVMQ